MSKTYTNEIWKDIPDYEGMYQISNHGRVKSLSKKVLRKGGSFFVTKEIILKPSVGLLGYIRYSLCKNNKQKTFRAHQLVAMVFLNHTPNGYEKVVDHIDNNKLNNHVDNLQIITSRENTSKDRKKHNSTSSKYVGVSFNKRSNNYQGFIRINGKNIYLGSFEKEYDAHLVYQKALEMYNNGDLSFIKSKK